MALGTNYVYEDLLMPSSAQVIPFVALTDKLVVNSASAASMFLEVSGADVYVDSVDAQLARTVGVILGSTSLQDLSVNNFLFGDGSFLYVDAGAGNSIFLTGNDDQVLGRGGNDVINALDGNDLIVLGGAGGASYGHDTVNGGYSTDGMLTGQTDTGTDTLTFFDDADRGANVNLATGAVTGGAASSGATILFGSIENVIGTAFNDVVTGSTAANVLRGQDGADKLIGGGGNDVLEGYGGDDTLNGGAGIDTADYSRSFGGIDVDLAAGTCTNDGFGDGMMIPFSVDALSLIENVLGSAQNDAIAGSSADNRLDGAAGNDNLTGADGNDVLIGGGGKDVLNGGTGTDNLNGGAGNDTLTWDEVDTAVNGGTGTDTLKVAAGNLNLAAIANTTIVNVEVINLTNGSNNVLKLSTLDVLDLSTTTNTLKVLGNAGDSINIVPAFTDMGVVSGFHQYTFGAATLLVDLDITSVA